MKRCSLLLLASLLGATALSATQPAPRPSATPRPTDTVNASDVGLLKRAVDIEIPAGHKLLVLYRTYHNQKIDNQHFLTCIPRKGGGHLPVELSALDPDVLTPTPTDKMKLTLPPRAGEWLTVKDKRMKSLGGATSSPMEFNRNYKITELKIGGDPQITANGITTPERPPELRVTIRIRIEPLIEKESAAQADYPMFIANEPEKFPFQDGDDN